MSRIVIILALGFALSFATPPGALFARQEQARQEEEAIRRVTASGGGFTRGERGTVISVSFGLTRAGDDDLAALRHFPRLEELNLNMTEVTDKGLAHLDGAKGLREAVLIHTAVTDEGVRRFCKGHPALELLWLRNTDITDACLPEVGRLERLDNLDLGNESPDTPQAALPGLEYLRGLRRKTTITDDGLVHLEKLHLRKLTLSDTKVTDRGMASVGKFTGLIELRLHDDAIGDAGLARLTGLTRLEQLVLRGTRVSDEGMKHVAQMKSLRVLSLAQTRVTDAGLEELTGLKHLVWLYLEEVRVTDKSVLVLARMKQLQCIDLTGTEVTEDGLKALRQALPRTRIISGPPPMRKIPPE